MTNDEMLAEIKRIIVENAALLGEPVRLGVRVRPNGIVRIQERIDGHWRRAWKPRDYSTVTAAYEAAQTANGRAHEIANRAAKGDTP